MQSRDSIAASRERAAAESGGVSGEPIYDLVGRMVSELELGGDVLDFGAGKGRLTERLRGTGYFDSVTGLDLMQRPEGIHEEIAWHACDLNDPTSLPGQSFDAIISAEVIEHLENPRAVAREWFRLLRPGGWLLFSTPNNESIRSILALIGRGHFQAFGDASYPAHITALLRKDIERIASEAGFEVLGFWFTDFGILPKARRRSWQGLSFGLLRGLRFSDNVLVVCKRPWES